MHHRPPILEASNINQPSVKPLSSIRNRKDFSIPLTFTFTRTWWSSAQDGDNVYATIITPGTFHRASPLNIYVVSGIPATPSPLPSSSSYRRYTRQHMHGHKFPVLGPWLVDVGINELMFRKKLPGRRNFKKHAERSRLHWIRDVCFGHRYRNRLPIVFVGDRIEVEVAYEEKSAEMCAILTNKRGTAGAISTV